MNAATDVKMCANCSERPGTLAWSGDMGAVMALRVMGSLPYWCALCVARAQLTHAKDRAAAIPELCERIARLEVLDEIARLTPRPQMHVPNSCATCGGGGFIDATPPAIIKPCPECGTRTIR